MTTQERTLKGEEVEKKGPALNFPELSAFKPYTSPEELPKAKLIDEKEARFKDGEARYRLQRSNEKRYEVIAVFRSGKGIETRHIRSLNLKNPRDQKMLADFKTLRIPVE